MSWEAIENAIMLLMAVGGSTNAVIHTRALAHELGISPDRVLDAFDRLSAIPHIAKVSPASTTQDCEDLTKPAVFRRSCAPSVNTFIPM